MKYFTKYLPVEGEIKSKDSFFEKDKLVLNWDNDADLPYINEKSHIKKAKLFLCSRDIQVGDMCKLFVRNRWEDYEVHENTDQSFINCGQKDNVLFHVIGEISSEATCIEGQEFTEDEVKLLTII